MLCASWAVLSCALLAAERQGIWLHEPAEGAVLANEEPLYVNLRTSPTWPSDRRWSVCLHVGGTGAPTCAALPSRIALLDDGAHVHNSFVLDGLPAGRHTLRVQLLDAATPASPPVQLPPRHVVVLASPSLGGDGDTAAAAGSPAFDVVMPCSASEVASTMPAALDGVRRFAPGARRILVVGPASARPHDWGRREDDGSGRRLAAEWVPEEVFPFGIGDVRAELAARLLLRNNSEMEVPPRGGATRSRGGRAGGGWGGGEGGPAAEAATRAGWYLQQLIKLHAPVVLPQLLPHVLVIDCDAVLLRPVLFLERATATAAATAAAAAAAAAASSHRPPAVALMDTSDQMHAPYFAHAGRLLPRLARRAPGFEAHSGVADHMVLDRHVLLCLIRAVELAAGGTIAAAAPSASGTGTSTPSSSSSSSSSSPPPPPPPSSSFSGDGGGGGGSGGGGGGGGGAAAIPFWRLFLRAIDPAEVLGSGASEYELYLHFALHHGMAEVPQAAAGRSGGEQCELLRASCPGVLPPGVGPALRLRKLKSARLCVQVPAPKHERSAALSAAAAAARAASVDDDVFAPSGAMLYHAPFDYAVCHRNLRRDNHVLPRSAVEWSDVLGGTYEKDPNAFTFPDGSSVL